MWKNTLWWTCVHNFECIFENGWLLIFWWYKMINSHAISKDFRIFSILIFCPIWTIHKVYTHFCVLDENQSESTPPKPKVFSLTFLWPRELGCPWTESLEWLLQILRSVPDTILVGFLTYFHFMRLQCETKQDLINHQTIWISADLWRYRRLR